MTLFWWETRKHVFDRYQDKDWVGTFLLISSPNFTIENWSMDNIQINQRTIASELCSRSEFEISAPLESINTTSQFPCYEEQ